MEVEGTGGAGGGEDCHAAFAGDEERPLVGSQVPMHLAHRTGLESEESHGEVVGDWEGGRVDNLHLTPIHSEWLLLREMVGVALIFGHKASGSVDLCRSFLQGRERRAFKDVQLAVGNCVKVGHVGLEVLCKNLTRVAHEQLRDQVGVVFGEVSLVENKQEL